MSDIFSSLRRRIGHPNDSDETITEHSHPYDGECVERVGGFVFPEKEE
jgi:hypothetical protein